MNFAYKIFNIFKPVKMEKIDEMGKFSPKKTG